MASVAKICFAALLLQSALATDCGITGSCNGDDKTSLVQVKQIVKHGSDRAPAKAASKEGSPWDGMVDESLKHSIMFGTFDLKIGPPEVLDRLKVKVSTMPDFMVFPAFHEAVLESAKLHSLHPLATPKTTWILTGAPKGFKTNEELTFELVARGEPKNVISDLVEVNTQRWHNHLVLKHEMAERGSKAHVVAGVSEVNSAKFKHALHMEEAVRGLGANRWKNALAAESAAHTIDADWRMGDDRDAVAKAMALKGRVEEGEVKAVEVHNAVRNAIYSKVARFDGVQAAKTGAADSAWRAAQFADGQKLEAHSRWKDSMEMAAWKMRMNQRDGIFVARQMFKDGLPFHWDPDAIPEIAAAGPAEVPAEIAAAAAERADIPEIAVAAAAPAEMSAAFTNPEVEANVAKGRVEANAANAQVLAAETDLAKDETVTTAKEAAKQAEAINAARMAKASQIEKAQKAAFDDAFASVKKYKEDKAAEFADVQKAARQQRVIDAHKLAAAAGAVKEKRAMEAQEVSTAEETWAKDLSPEHDIQAALTAGDSMEEAILQGKSSDKDIDSWSNGLAGLLVG